MAPTMKLKLILVALALSYFSCVVSAAKILVHPTHPFSQPSHNLFLNAFSTGLQARGHRVSVLAPDTFKLRGFNPDSYHELITFKTTTTEVAIQQLDEDFSESLGGDFMKQLQMFMPFMNLPYQNCEDLFNDVAVLEKLKREKFDLLLLELFMPCELLLSEYLNVPFVIVTGSPRLFIIEENVFGMPAPPSYVPLNAMNSYTNDMTFTQRLNNYIFANIGQPLMFYFFATQYDRIRATYDHDPRTSLRELVGKAELWLCQTDFALDFARPTVPNWIPIAGILASDSKPLPQDLEDFVQGSGEHGVILFSLGSTGTSLMTYETNEIFAHVFSELPQRVLWRYKGIPLRNLGNNTRIMEWLPQNDLLGHPKTRLMIYHGGNNGVYEALYHKVPLVLVPLFADQPSVAARAAKKGFGLVLDKKTLTYTSLKEAITEVLKNSSYKEKAVKYGSIHRDTLASPMDTAIFWIEHVLKFGGGHLKSRANELNFFVLNSLDVIAFLLIISLIILYVDFLVLRSCYRCICGKKSSKEKSD